MPLKAAKEVCLMPLTYATHARTRVKNAKWRTYSISTPIPVHNATKDSNQMVNRAALFKAIQMVLVPLEPIYYLLILLPINQEDVKNVLKTVLIAP